MTATADELLRWLLEDCIYCGKPHEARDSMGGGMTWADPVDGHAYGRRIHLMHASDIRPAWQRRQAEQERSAQLDGAAPVDGDAP